MSPEIVSAVVTFLTGAAGVKIIEFILARLGTGNNGAALRRELREDNMVLRARLKECEAESDRRDKELDYLREERSHLMGMLRDRGVEI